MDETKETSRGKRATKVGLVVSNAMDKTVVVAVEQLIKHERYKKFVKRTNRFFAHDEKNECQIGEKVQIMETRPLSRKKRWRVISKLGK